jgi:hypothetical protein
MAARKEANIPVRQPLPAVGILSKDKKELPQELLEVLSDELNVKSSVLGEVSGQSVKATDGAGTTVVLLTEITPELKLEGEVRKLERAIQEKRKEMLIYTAQDVDTEAALQKIDKKKTYIVEVRKGEGGSPGLELEKL